MFWFLYMVDDYSIFDILSSFSFQVKCWRRWRSLASSRRLCWRAEKKMTHRRAPSLPAGREDSFKRDRLTIELFCVELLLLPFVYIYLFIIRFSCVFVCLSVCVCCCVDSSCVGWRVIVQQVFLPSTNKPQDPTTKSTIVNHWVFLCRLSPPPFFCWGCCRSIVQQ